MSDKEAELQSFRFKVHNFDQILEFFSGDNICELSVFYCKRYVCQ